MPAYQPKEGSSYQAEMPREGSPVWFVISLVTGLLLGVGLLVYSAEKEVARKFIYMRGCIEYHSEDTCQLYWKYDRPDLGLRR